MKRLTHKRKQLLATLALMLAVCLFFVWLGAGMYRSVPQADRGKLYLRMDTGDQALMGDVKLQLKRYPGDIPVVLVDGVSLSQRQVPESAYVNNSEALITALSGLLGEANVKKK